MESKLFRLKRVKAQIWRFLPAFFLFLSLTLIVLGVTGNPVIKWMESKSVSVVTPIVSVISKPLYWLKNGMEGIKNWTRTYQENTRLKEENAYLLQWRSLALQLFLEQKELKEYLNYIPPKKTKSLVAKIALDEGSAFSRSFIVSVGENKVFKKECWLFHPKDFLHAL